ncbi:MAG: TetR/AcrR family transcriptional regulator [Klenkia sp.]|nr:TetR/AcrR family transcriptional regulator [Klenkia sp.]
MPRTDRRPRTRHDPAVRRAEILAVATVLFGAHAYPEVALTAIAERVGVSEALVLRYFGTKAELYTAVVDAALTRLRAGHDAADAALPADAPPRSRVARSIEVYLDAVAAAPVGWSAPLRGEGVPAADRLRAQARTGYVDRLAAVLDVDPAGNPGLALRGYLGFLESACLAWADQGCPPTSRPALLAMSLDALQAALTAARTPP